MKFTELRKIMDEIFGTSLLSDIAKEFEVTPQVVSNWKSRDQVPYKYVRIIRDKIKEKNSYSSFNNEFSENPYFIPTKNINNIENQNEDTLKTIIYYFSIFRKHKYVMLIVPTVFLILQLISLKYYSVPVYVSKATILPSKVSEGNRNLRSFAQQFGISANNQNSIDLSSSILFPEILSSKRLARELLNKKFDTKKYGPNRSLISIINGYDDDRAEFSEISKIKAVKRLLKLIRVRPQKTSPLLNISVSTFEAQFAADLLNALINEFRQLLKTFRISQLQEKKTYITQRLGMVEKELIKSEDILKSFRQENRMILSSPTLLLQEERLSREVLVQTEVVINLKNQFEMVQIEEIGESSALQVLDSPEAPTFRSGPNVIRSVLLSIIIGFFLAAACVIAKETLPFLRLKSLTL